MMDAPLGLVCAGQAEMYMIREKVPGNHRVLIGLGAATSLAGSSVKWKTQAPCSKVVPNLNTVTVEHEALGPSKLRAQVSHPRS